MRQNCCKLDQCVTGQFHYRHEITYSAAAVALALFYEPINNRVFPAAGSADARLAEPRCTPFERMLLPLRQAL